MPKYKTDAEQIVKIALSIFLEKGYHKTSMSDIGDATGLLKGSLYHYFDSKKDLMIAIIKSVHEWYRREIFSIQEEDMSTEEKVNALIHQSEEVFFNRKGGSFMTNIALETLHVVPEFTSLIRQFFKDWISCIETVFAEAMPDKTASILARQAVSDIEGAVMMMELFNDKTYLRRVHNRIIESFKSNVLN